NEYQLVKRWIMKQSKLFNATGNPCSIDPGACTPWMVFDFNDSAR
ncbi:17294_t:CDS:1, partial [Entrophospora sp. SA101]